MTTRSQKKSLLSENGDKIKQKRIENSWTLLINANGNASKFCLDNVHNKMYEVVTFSEPYRSWFIGEYVKSDGSMSMATPFNPLFLVLPRLKEQCVDRAMPLEDLLSEKGFDKIIGYINNMDYIGDLKGPAEMKAYKYNEEKTLKWLEERVHNVAKVLKKKHIHVTPGAVSATFVTSNLSSDNIDDEFYLKYAHGIVSEYLQDDLIVKLEKKLNFKPEIIECIGKKRKSEVELNNSIKKVKSESTSDDPIEVNNISNNFSEAKKKPMTAKEKARQKAASGTKTISAFFTKK
ncbi:ribonuclease H2 subunit B isoform X2 [Battus philenor]|uniref:ribonuclease H2 subunit B isoform X2 n=1 Tax=Battus philenor TaxID=42288 RepID=UPI0035D11F32